MKYYIIQIGENNPFKKTFLYYNLKQGFSLTSMAHATIFTEEHVINDDFLKNYIQDKEYHIIEREVEKYEFNLFRYRH